jgi:myo-inositol-1(or 4)-monophosphatase
VSVDLRTVAHRGDSSRFRENTLVAIQSAIDAGASTVEIDVRVTLDGHVVVLHDPTLDRLWGVDRAVSDLTLAEVQELGGGDLRIPTLVEVLALFDKTDSLLLIDMDAADPAAPAWHVVKEHAIRPVAWCGATEAMRVIRDLDADATIWLAWARADAPTLSDLEELRPAVLNLPHLVVGRTLVDDAHALGLLVSCWTVDDEAQMKWLKSVGVDSLTSNRLDLLMDVAGEEDTTADAGHAGESVPRESVGVSAADRARALVIARDLGRWAVDYVTTHPIGSVVTKANPADHVTEIDTAIETMVRAVIGAQFPHHGFVGEEFGGVSTAGQPCWYLDPVDGTANLANGMPWTSFSLALAVDREPLVAVVGDAWSGRTLSAIAGGGAFVDGLPIALPPLGSSALRGAMVSTELAGHAPWPGMLRLLELLGGEFCTLRVMGSGTLTLAGVALGRGHGAVIGRFSPIDHVAAALIVREAGGTVWDMEGRDTLFPESGGILVARDRVAAAELHTLWVASMEHEAQISTQVLAPI